VVALALACGWLSNGRFRTSWAYAGWALLGVDMLRGRIDMRADRIVASELMLINERALPSIFCARNEQTGTGGPAGFTSDSLTLTFRCGEDFGFDGVIAAGAPPAKLDRNPARRPRLADACAGRDTT